MPTFTVTPSYSITEDGVANAAIVVKDVASTISVEHIEADVHAIVAKVKVALKGTEEKVLAEIEKLAHSVVDHVKGEI
jgi:hypothetical protein